METVGEVQARLLGILRDAVVVRVCIEENPGPLEGDPTRYQAEMARLDTAVLVAKACCLASGLDENSVRFMTNAPIVNLTPENLDRARKTVGSGSRNP